MTAARAGRLRWTDGFVFALTMPAALIATLGYSVGALGGWAAVTLWGVSMVIAVGANWIYSEMAAMFPHLSGGISLYAHEAWKGRFEAAGPIASFGYWFAWTGSIAVYGEIIGSLVQAEWFPGQDWTVHAGFVDITFARVVAAGLVVAIWAANTAGLRPTLLVAYATAAALAVPLVVFALVPYFTGDWDPSRLTWGLGAEGQEWGGWRLAIVWLYVMLWTSLGVETCATFAPEYGDPVRDTTRALRAAALFCLAVFVLLPLGVTGVVGEQAAAADPIGIYQVGFEILTGGAGGVMIALVIGSLILVMTSSFADGSRALSGVARQGLTVRQLGETSPDGVPRRALLVDLVTNLCLIFLLGDLLAIVAAGNIGYLVAHILALSGFVLLRRDRPTAERPIRLHRAFVPLAAGLVVVLAVVLVVGAASFDLTGYGDLRELVVALIVLSLSVVLFAVRRVLQDGGRLRLRAPSEPSVTVTPPATAPR
jgi:amino acid transporter